MKLFTYLSSLIFVFSLNFLCAQECSVLLKHFDLDGEETVWHSASNNEGHIYICGTLTKSFNQNGSFILKTDKEGNSIWQK